MQRRAFLACLVSAALAAACATAPEPAPPAPSAGGFVSDRIGVVAQGQGPDVILIPGLTSHRDVWAATAAALDDRYRVHLVQVNGFAGFGSGANEEGPVAAPVAEEIARYIREQNLQAPAVIGHSMGGTIGMMLAARHPDAVGRLMVVDMIPFMGVMFGGPQATAETLRPQADRIRAQMLSAPPGASAPMVEQMIANMVRTEEARPVLLRHARESDRDTVANAFHELIVTDLRPELPNIAAPMTVLYVIPPNTPMSPAQYESFLRFFYANAPDVRIVKIEDSYHFIMVDQFDRFMREVRTFLQD